MLERLLGTLHNWFEIEGGRHYGEYRIEGGALALPFLLPGQYFRIQGSVFNDGLRQYPADGLVDEEFTGTVTALAVPKAVIGLAGEIEEWEKKNGEASMEPYQSESFGGYTYTKVTESKTGGAVTWETAFRSRLAEWRKL